jgi:hypothetical protein
MYKNRGIFSPQKKLPQLYIKINLNYIINLLLKTIFAFYFVRIMELIRNCKAVEMHQGFMALLDRNEKAADIYFSFYCEYKSH